MIKTILCYGDSNTFGAATVERPDGRYALAERWPGVLAAQLGPGWRVIEEGLNGRTTVRDDPVEGEYRNGKTHLLPCLLSHMPLDAVAIMLGTNDLKARFNVSAWDIAEGVGVLVEIVRGAGVGHGGGTPEILVIAPPPILQALPFHADMFAGAYDKAQQFAGRYAAMAQALGVHFLDAGAVATSSAHDGFHLDPEAHHALGEAVAAKIEAFTR
ncbi:MAG: SGNH/GDSL hydrolase family protein [Alphaproteobacteria bacterium]